jgi:hypothetical protein
MAEPAIDTLTAKVASEIPRGLRIRASQELTSARERAEETGRHPIPLPLFFFLLMLALMLDLATLVPGLGTIFNFLIGPIIWVTYYVVGTKGLAAAVKKWIVAFLAGAGFFAELIPGVQVLPINTVVAITVYLLMSPRVTAIFERVGKLTGVAEKAMPVVRKVIAHAK